MTKKGDYRKKSKTSPVKHTQPMTFDQIHKGCMDKTRFHRRKTVRAAAKELGYRYYKCPFCGDFHLTKSKGAINPWNE